ncbi:growth/differentiation factor 8, partial [Drosophila serrata]|uniref:growth/differentiation factor 8 n=1 Tax=Drosophila serrata TaxID=7274 RepID=UPI000A1D0D13
SRLLTYDSEKEKYDNILSHISSIYIFPEQFQPHARNNRNRNKPKADFLRFKIANSYTDLSYVTLHLYLRGWDWISTHQPELIEEIEKQQSKDIVVTIYRAVRRSTNSSITHKAKIFEFRQRIPSGLGEWVNVDLLKSLFNVDRGGNKTQEILIKGAEFWMKPLVVTTDYATSKNPLTVHIEVGSQKKHRRKRSVFLDCTENDHDMRCCRYPLKVNFTSFGWHFVVAPTSFDAFFCSGDCKVGYLEQYPHTHLAALTTSATPCCSPTKMSSLSLLYFDDNHNLVLSVIPNMSVEGCSCS